MNMVKRKRTVLALLLALCMIVMLLPATVFAEGENGVASVTDNLNGEGVIAGGTTNGGADDQTVGAVAKDALDKPEGSVAKDTTDKSANGNTDKPEGIVVKGASDTPGGPRIKVNTTVRDNFTDCLVTDAINVTVGQDYIIDFTKADNLSYALRSMADPNKTKYYKFANADQNSLIETENPDEALLKIVGHKDKNKAVMTLVQRIDKDMSFDLDFMQTQYTGSKLTYTGQTTDKETETIVINEIRDDYYTRYRFNCKLNLIAVPEVIPEQGSTEPGTVDQGKDSNTAAKTESKGKKTDSSAKTGDDGNPMLWAGILLLAAAGAGTAVFYRRKADH
mgnify:CR=1 FL=1